MAKLDIRKIVKETGGAGALQRGAKQKRKTFADYQNISPKLPKRLRSYLATASLTAGTRALKLYRTTREIPGVPSTRRPRQRRRKRSETGLDTLRFVPTSKGK